MAFKKLDEKRGLSLPGLIDIIFLLLVFSLVTLSVSQSRMEQRTKGDKNVEFELPEMRSRITEESDAVVRTLVFQIEHQEFRNPSSPRVLYILKPSLTDPINFEEAKQMAVQDSMFATFPLNFISLGDREFESLAACRLIRNSLAEYKQANFFEPNLSNSVEIRAVKDMEFRIFNYILDRCSVYGDTIPQIVLHTLGGREVGREL